MTIEEAIEVLAQDLPCEIDKDLSEAMTMAIEALEEKSCEDWYDVPSNEMTLEQARQAVKDLRKKLAERLDQQRCEMTVGEYRQRMIDAFHNADCDNLIALVALPSEKEFEHLEWLLKNHYHNQKQEPCDDCISRQVGHWIFDEILDKHYYCSECKSMGVDYWDYCPYCGAKMVEPQESEE